MYHDAYTPPDCDDPRTLALVHTSLTGHFKLPDSVRLEAIRTLVGGYIGFRFVCQAELTGFARNQLPPNTSVPASVHYISRLTQNGQRHEVSVSTEPRLILEPAE